MIAIKALLWGVLLAPGTWLGYQAWLLLDGGLPGLGPLGGDPVEYIVRFLGDWSIRFLLASLFVSSLARRLRKPAIIRVRRLIGLFAFAYVTAHFMGYVFLLAEARWSEIFSDFTDRPYITVGLAGWISLLPLAITSTRGWQRKLGKRWRQLHRLVYLAVVAGLVHLFWLTRDGYGELVIYAVIALALFAERRFKPARRKPTKTASPAVATEPLIGESSPQAES